MVVQAGSALADCDRLAHTCCRALVFLPVLCFRFLSFAVGRCPQIPDFAKLNLIEVNVIAKAADVAKQIADRNSLARSHFFDEKNCSVLCKIIHLDSYSGRRRLLQRYFSQSTKAAPGFNAQCFRATTPTQPIC